MKAVENTINQKGTSVYKKDQKGTYDTVIKRHSKLIEGKQKTKCGLRMNSESQARSDTTAFETKLNLLQISLLEL